MKKHIQQIIIALVVMLLGASALQAPVSATKALTMSPMSQRIILVPGERYKGSFNVSNPQTSDEDFNYSVSVDSYSIAGSDAGAAELSNYNMITNWIKITNPTGRLAPGTTNVVEFTIDVPDDAPAGGQYATLPVTEEREASAQGDSLGIVEKIQMVMTIYAEVAGETLKDGDITENNVPTFLLNNELTATAMVRNDGNVHTDAEYTLQVWPMVGDEEICTNEEEPDTSLILPGTERFHTQSCNLPVVGVFRVKQVVRIFDTISTVEKTIVVCPLWLLFVVVLGIAAIIIWLVIRAKNRK